MPRLALLFVLSLPFADAAALQAEIQLAQPTANSVVQRDFQNQAELKVAGTYAGEVTKIEARVVPRGRREGKPTGWQEIDAAPTDGKFAGKLRVFGGWYDLEVRSLNGETVVEEATIPAVGVGDVFITAGQSNSANHGGPPQKADPRVSARTAVTGDTWQHANDPQPIATGKGGSPWPLLGNLLVQKNRVPVGFVSVGVGATAVAQWAPGGKLYDQRLKPAIQSLGPHGFYAILWHQGESDTLKKTSAEAYAAQLQAIIAQSRTDAGFEVPWGVAIASYHPRGKPQEAAQIAMGQKKVIADDPLVFEGPTTDGIHTLGGLIDSVHFNQKGLNLHAAGWFNPLTAHQAQALRAARTKATGN